MKHKWYVSSDSSAVIREEAPTYSAGIRVVTNTFNYFLGCCGLAGLEGFNSMSGFKDWNDKAEWLACLYRSLYYRGHVVYCITDWQLENAAHIALLEIGSREIAVFPNLYHGPRMLHLFVVNVRNTAGRFCNKYGEAYPVPPKDDSEIIPEQTEPSVASVYQTLPVRGV
jgi:hypothetical protein